MKHVSDGERLAIAALNRKETELVEARKELDNLKAQLRAMSANISELKEAKAMLCAQVRYLVSKKNQNA